MPSGAPVADCCASPGAAQAAAEVQSIYRALITPDRNGEGRTRRRSVRTHGTARSPVVEPRAPAELRWEPSRWQRGI